MALWSTFAGGCGYAPVNLVRPNERMTVVVGQVLVPETLAVQAAAAGARSELAVLGVLASGAAFPRLVLDVLRVDEVARGILAQNGRPSAGGSSLAVTVRARLFNAEHQDAALDSGDVRRSAEFAADSNAEASARTYDIQIRSAAERAGRDAARAVLGLPEPADETP